MPHLKRHTSCGIFISAKVHTAISEMFDSVKHNKLVQVCVPEIGEHVTIYGFCSSCLIKVCVNKTKVCVREWNELVA